MAKPSIPRAVGGRLYFYVADVISPAVAQSATAASAAEAKRLEVGESGPQPPVRRCDDCALNLGRDVLRALGSCPRWGQLRHGVESRCPAFVAKGGAR